MSCEDHTDARKVLYALGPQLVTNFTLIVAQDENQGWLEIERALGDQRTALVFDNMESVLEPPEDSPLAASFETDVLQNILELCQKLQNVAETRLIFTSRQEMPEPFGKNHIGISRPDRREAIELVGKVLGQEGLTPQSSDPGESEDDIEKLVDAVNCHARSLVLLAGKVSTSGVRNATERMHELMTSLAEKYPDDRERSLYASVELSLQRLPQETREEIRPLGVFQGGGNVATIGQVLGLEIKDAIEAATHLASVGLAELLPLQNLPYLRLHPALGPLLLNELTEARRDAAQSAWAEATAQLADFLHQYQDQNPELAQGLALLELPNLLASLQHLQQTADPSRVVNMAVSVENILRNLGRHKSLSRAATIREEAAQRLGDWSHAQFKAGSAEVDHLSESGRHVEAVEKAKDIVQQADQAGEEAYIGASYDLALAYAQLGRAFQMGGNSGAALATLDEAGKRLQKLADAGDNVAKRTASVCLTERASCFLSLGRLDEAAAAYQQASRNAQERRDPRSVATNKTNLATVRIEQRKYPEALAAYDEALEIFEGLEEPRTVAAVLHQVGVIHEETGQHDEAEKAYQKALQIEVQIGDRSREASTLNQLGNLYKSMRRIEHSVRFHRQAADIYVELKDTVNEGIARHNAADDLIALRRYDEARNEIEQAIECKRGLGHAAKPWATLNILHGLERTVRNDRAAAEARQKAIDSYLAYRRDGGQIPSGGDRIFEMVRSAMAQGETEAAFQALAQLSEHADAPDQLKLLIPALQAILAGSRDPNLAVDPDLDYIDAVELRLLLEELAAKGP